MMDLKFLCYLVHCWHRILMYFTLGGCCGLAIRIVIWAVIVTRKYFTLEDVAVSLLSLVSSLSDWLPFGVGVPQVCLHHCELCPRWSWYQSLSLRIFLFGRVLRSGKLQYFLQYFRLLYCLFHFGRVFRVGNEQCIWWWCCHSCELGIGPMVLLGGSLQIGAFSRAHHWQVSSEVLI